MSNGNTAITRSVSEITASIRLRMVNVAVNVIGIGRDLTELKEQVSHGEWLPKLQELGISSSTASNYMRLAREIPEGSAMEHLPYTKALALLAAPPEEREEIAQGADDKSAAEIRKLIEERNRAAEAANVETARADQAEAEAKRFYAENAELNTKLQNVNHLAHCLREDLQTTDDLLKMEKARAQELEKQLGRNQAELEQLRGDLASEKAGKQTVEIEVEKRVEVAPADYEELKRNQEDLISAAEEAEERASALEKELAELKDMQNAQRPLDVQSNALFIRKQIDNFLIGMNVWPENPRGMASEAWLIRNEVKRISRWVDNMTAALDEAETMAEPIEAEGTVTAI
jgi:DNA repair exonuclease SbcCD ATPase subunit